MHIKRKEIVQCGGLQNAAVQNKFKKVSNKQNGRSHFLVGPETGQDHAGRRDVWAFVGKNISQPTMNLNGCPISRIV